MGDPIWGWRAQNGTEYNFSRMGSMGFEHRYRSGSLIRWMNSPQMKKHFRDDLAILRAGEEILVVTSKGEWVLGGFPKFSPPEEEPPWGEGG